MKTITKIVCPVSLVLVMAAGCANDVTQPKATLHSSFGDAVRHNMAVQIQNPEGHPDLSPSALDGARAGRAIQRYRTGETEALQVQRTSGVGKSESGK